MISCADTGASCPARFVSDNQLELIEQMRKHIATSHPEQVKATPPTERVKKLIKET
ncbi:MAG TPA: DUF1059 domain-containing protein [Myxococcaceae bacterium]|nr:DUF1059 domain-containing protein [Myxococcaceae bacterium]